MAREVVWTEVAAYDLDEIAEYIGRDSLMYAATFITEVRTASRSLNVMAERGRIVPEVEAADIRELILGNFRLIFQVTERVVFVLRLIHGARQFPGVSRQ